MKKLICNKCYPYSEKWIDTNDNIEFKSDLLKNIGIQGNYFDAECATIGISGNVSKTEEKLMTQENGCIKDILQNEELEENIKKSLGVLIEKNNHRYYSEWKNGKKLEALSKLAYLKLLVNIDIIKCRVPNCPELLLNNCYINFLETLETLEKLKLIILIGNKPINIVLKKTFKTKIFKHFWKVFLNRNENNGQIIIIKPSSCNELIINNKKMSLQDLCSKKYFVCNYTNLDLENHFDKVIILMMHLSNYGKFQKQLDNEMTNLSNLIIQ